MISDLIGWVDNVKAKAQSKNVVFSLMDLR